MQVTLTGGGSVLGAESDGALVFKGVPYATAARFAEPQPTSWDGERDATAHGPMCPQPSGEQWLRHDLGHDEDCLSLTITTPALDGSRPVMVWIHGGGFRQGSGSGPLYDAEVLATRGDVVVVSINYRLGALGFLNHHQQRRDDGSSGNWGLLDQIESLRWVQREIANFGGDPDNVTILGESAGAGSVALLMVSPPARGLFHRAVVQSGAPITISARRGEALAEQLATEVGTDVAGLATVDIKELVDAQIQIENRAGGEMMFLPTVDGTVIPDIPLLAYQRGEAAPVPLVIGTNSDEWKLWAPGDPHSRDLTDDHLRARVRKLVGEGTDEVIAAYTESRASQGLGIAPTDIWYAIKTDQFFRVPSIRVADAHARHQPTFNYLFEWGSPAMGGWMGACHALEIAFVFGTYDKPVISNWTGKGPDADLVHEAMADAWIAFATTGSPSTDQLEWPLHNAEARPTMCFDTDTRVESAPSDREREVLDQFL